MAKREVFMSKQRYPEEFKIEAVKQVTVLGHSVADVAQRLRLTAFTHGLGVTALTQKSIARSPMMLRRSDAYRRS